MVKIGAVGTIDTIDKIKDNLVKNRRDFHQFPEIGWTEFRTASKIARALKNLGFDVALGRAVIDKDARMGVPTAEVLETCYNRAILEGGDLEILPFLKGGFTGVVGTMVFGDGPIIALRFDIDALKIQESSDEEHFPKKEGFSSCHDNVMHACGHDCHGAIGLAVAEILGTEGLNQKNKGTIKLIFQPAEEGVRGAKSIVAAGILDNVDYIIGSHVMAEKKGVLICGANGSMATSKWDVSFIGRPAHAGAAPQEGKNAILALCNTVLNLHSISRHGSGATRINVGRIKGGSDRNIIPDNSSMEMEIRGENNETHEYMKDYAHRIIENGAKMHDVEYTMLHVGEAPSGSSSEELVKKIQLVGQNMKCFHTIIPMSNKSSGSEDFNFMLNKVQENGGQGAYFQIGSDKITGHHTTTFDIDENILFDAVQVFIGVVNEILK